MDGLRFAYYLSWFLTVTLAFSIALLRKFIPEKADENACNSAIRTFLDTRAPLIPNYWYNNTASLFFIVPAALAGMACQIIVVHVANPPETVVVCLMFYNFVSALWPVSPKTFASCKQNENSYFRPQSVVVSVSFTFMCAGYGLYLESYLEEDGKGWALILLSFEVLTTCMDLILYIKPWDAPPKQDPLTKNFNIDNDQCGYTID